MLEQYGWLIFSVINAKILSIILEEERGKMKRFDKFILGDDLDFYEKYLLELSDDEQKKFFDENPDFMSGYPLVTYDYIHLLKDPIYRGLIRRIKAEEDQEI